MDSLVSARYNIFTFRIPQNVCGEELHGLAAKYKALRLLGLQLSPEAFSSTLAVESQYSDKVWTSRLENTQLETFVCAVAPLQSSTDEKADINGTNLEWVACATLRGPLSIPDFTLPVESGQASLDPASANTEERWQFLSLYSLPSFRGQGLAKKLCQEALGWLQKSRLHNNSAINTIRVRTMIKPDNKASLSLFGKLGFQDIGRCTLAEALVANGEAIPSEWGEDDARRHTRHGCILGLQLKGDL